MENRQWVFTAKCAAILAVVPIMIFANSLGAPIRNTGAPGETTCAQAGCHAGTVNSGPGSIQVQFSGSGYQPGVRQTVTVTAAGTEGRVFGIQVSPRLASDPRTGAGGSLIATSTNLEVLCQDGRLKPSVGCPTSAPLEYLSHTTPNQQNTFTFDWVPAANATGDIQFYVAVNAANNNFQNTGDRIYTTTATVSPAAAGGGSRPTVPQNGIISGASLPSQVRAFASGSWLAIFGQNLALRTVEWGSFFSNAVAPTSLDNVRVQVNGRDAFVAFVSPGQINAIVPEDVGTGSGTVRVINANGESDPIPVTLQQAAPAFFTDNAGARQKAATDPARAVRPGEIITLFASGFGPTNPRLPVGRIVSQGTGLEQSFTITVGGRQAQVQYAGAAPALVGLYQVNLVVPDLPDGDHEVIATVGGTQTPVNVVISVAR